MKPVPIHAAKTHLSRLIAQACAGEDVVISHGDVPVVRLVPIQPATSGRVFGALRGKITIDDRFFEPLPDSEITAWDGR